MTYKQFYHSLITMMICLVLMTAVAAASPERIRVIWPSVPDAVGYELEITDKYFSADDATDMVSHIVANLASTTAGAEISGSFLQKKSTLWWRVRGLNLTGGPVSDFTESQRLSEGESDPQFPLPLTAYSDDSAVPLYPAYSWVPVLAADGYDVEVLNVRLADNQRSQICQQVAWYHIDGGNSFDCYDLHSYNTAGTYYWRVRAVNSLGQSLGHWSPSMPFTVTTTGYAAAALGDSITHGGGAVSSPPGTPMYDWTQSVTVSVKNLGRSGDTTEAMLARFNQDVLPFHPPVLIIAGGINDIRDGTGASQIISNLSAIRQKCLTLHITPVFVTLAPVNPSKLATIIGAPLPPQWRTNWQSVNNWILSQPNAVDTTLLLMDDQGLLPDKLSTDGLHPDSEGKRLIGQAVSKKLYEMKNNSR